MIAKDFISHEIPILKSTDKVFQVLEWMDEFRVMHLPVFSGSMFKGVVSESDLLDWKDDQSEIVELESHFQLVSVQEEKSIYDVIKSLDDYKLSLIPVIDENDNFKGTISYKEVMSALVNMLNLNSAGAVFILEMNYVDYSLSEIARHVEANDARVMSSHISFHEDSGVVDVIVKVNTDSISSIVQTLERYDYVVKATIKESKDDDPMDDRYDALMRYLNT